MSLLLAIGLIFVGFLVGHCMGWNLGKEDTIKAMRKSWTEEKGGMS